LLKIRITLLSSLGRARAKASVMNNNGNLWIPKFPNRSEAKNIGGWKMVTYKLAVRFGLNIIS